MAESLGQHVIVARVAGEGLAGASAGVQPGDATAVPAFVSRQAAAERGHWLAELDGLTPDARLDRLRELVCGQVMQIMRLDAGSPPSSNDRLMDLGMDSLMAVQLRNALNRALSLERGLASTLMFDYPTIDAIARHLHGRMYSAVMPDVAAPSAAAPAAVALGAGDVADLSDEDIARLLDERLGAP